MLLIPARQAKGRSARILWRRWRAGAALLVLVFAIILATCRRQLLCVTSSLRDSDAIVVLGGEPILRAKHAATLAANGLAPLVVASGFGDCETMRGVLVRDGVRTNVIELECASTSTRQNALFTASLLRAHGCQRVILVTSWYHSRRALSSFRKYAPEIEFLSSPAPRTRPWLEERGYIATEYLKIVGYALRFGIWPTGAGSRGNRKAEDGGP